MEDSQHPTHMKSPEQCHIATCSSPWRKTHLVVTEGGCSSHPAPHTGMQFLTPSTRSPRTPRTPLSNHSRMSLGYTEFPVKSHGNSHQVRKIDNLGHRLFPVVHCILCLTRNTLTVALVALILPNTRRISLSPHPGFGDN